MFSPIPAARPSSKSLLCRRWQPDLSCRPPRGQHIPTAVVTMGSMCAGMEAVGHGRPPNEEETAVLTKMQTLACERFEPDSHPGHEEMLKRCDCCRTTYPRRRPDRGLTTATLRFVAFSDEVRVWTTFHDNVHGVEKPFERHHTDWQKIGFQGSDPVSDIRGGGVLAVAQILYFFERRTDIAVGIAEDNEPEATGEEFNYEGPYYPFATAR